MYSFYMAGVLLPVTPSALKIKIKNKNQTIQLINHTEVNILKKPGLSDINFTTMLPMNAGYPFAVYTGGFRPPEYYLALFKSLKLEDTKPFRWTVSRMSPDGRRMFFDSSMDVSIEDYEISESADNGPDVYVSIDLKEYRQYGTKLYVPAINSGSGVSASGSDGSDGSTGSLGSGSASGGAGSTQGTGMSGSGAGVLAASGTMAAIQVIQQRLTNKTIPKTYTVKSGDTLWAIAKRELGDGAKYTDIAKLNGIADPNRIQAGQVISLS